MLLNGSEIRVHGVPFALRCDFRCLVNSDSWSNTLEGKRMDSARHTEKFMGTNQDSTSSSVAPEVLRTSRGADAPTFVALRAPLRQTQRLSGLLSCYCTVRLGKAKFDSRGSSRMELKLCEPQDACYRRMHTKPQLLKCPWSKVTMC